MENIFLCVACLQLFDDLWIHSVQSFAVLLPNHSWNYNQKVCLVVAIKRLKFDHFVDFVRFFSLSPKITKINKTKKNNKLIKADLNGIFVCALLCFFSSSLILFVQNLFQSSIKVLWNVIKKIRLKCFEWQFFVLFYFVLLVGICFASIEILIANWIHLCSLTKCH